MPGKPGSFAAYLEYTQRVLATPALFRESLSRKPDPVDLLGMLDRQSAGSISIGHLASLCNCSAAAFYQILKASSEAGLVRVEGPALEETITLTPQGRNIAKAARPQ